jgi:hypothetical protein
VETTALGQRPVRVRTFARLQAIGPRWLRPATTRRGVVLDVALLALTVAPASASDRLLAPGLYRDTSGHTSYVGIEHELPEAPVNEYFDSATQRCGDLTPRGPTSGRWPLRCLSPDSSGESGLNA